MTTIAGLDIGGAHVKAARLVEGQLVAVEQHPCPLWLGLDKLDATVAGLAHVTNGADAVAITMTAELTEIFQSRESGAATLIKHLDAAFPGRASFFAGLPGLVPAASALRDPLATGSANFLATAHAIARCVPRALLIDFGSTTADIIACDRPQGLTDAERLQTGELVYTGYTRTPVPSVTTRAPLLGTWQTLARDAFANMADVRRILGVLPDCADQHDTTDGRSKSVEDSLRRFARGFGRDGEMRHLEGWKVAAAYIDQVQQRSIYDGAIQVLSRPGLSIGTGIAAGVGWPLAAAAAASLGLPPARTFGDVIGAPQSLRTAATCYAPAVAVALALHKRRG